MKCLKAEINEHYSKYHRTYDRSRIIILLRHNYFSAAASKSKRRRILSCSDIYFQLNKSVLLQFIFCRRVSLHVGFDAFSLNAIHIHMHTNTCTTQMRREKKENKIYNLCRFVINHTRLSGNLFLHIFGSENTRFS